jgi:predicted lipid-binding transport protein (Tim44 family)
MQNFQFLEIVLFGLLAGFMAFRLYSVLGRRTGHERTRDDRLRLPDGAQPNPKAPPVKPPAKDNVVALPDRPSPPAPVAAATGPIARGLMDIKLKDRNFDTEKFLSGARSAYEMIVTAFAHGDRATLHELLSDDVYGTFDKAISAREARKERVDFTFLALKNARITAAEMKDRMADVTITFESEVMMAGYDQNGVLIEGDPKTPREVTEIWTFARDTHSGDPNWMLTATANGA